MQSCIKTSHPATGAGIEAGSAFQPMKSQHLQHVTVPFPAHLLCVSTVATQASLHLIYMRPYYLERLNQVGSYTINSHFLYLLRQNPNTKTVMNAKAMFTKTFFSTVVDTFLSNCAKSIFMVLPNIHTRTCHCKTIFSIFIAPLPPPKNVS